MALIERSAPSWARTALQVSTCGVCVHLGRIHSCGHPLLGPRVTRVDPLFCAGPRQSYAWLHMYNDPALGHASWAAPWAMPFAIICHHECFTGIVLRSWRGYGTSFWALRVGVYTCFKIMPAMQSEISLCWDLLSLRHGQPTSMEPTLLILFLT